MSLEIYLARSRGDVAARYAAARALGGFPDLAAARRLVELLADDAVGESQYSPFADDHLDTTVADAALESLIRLLPLAWPALVDALRVDNASAARAIALIRRMAPRDRLAMPADAHDTVAAYANDEPARFERELARRHRDGELDGWEAVWQVWIRDHPTQRTAGVALLAEAAADPSAVAFQLVELLDDPQLAYAVSQALRALPVVPGASWVRAVAESEWPRTYVALLPALARYGEEAAAILPICVDVLDVGMPHPGAGARWKVAIEALRAFGPLAERVRPQLVERFVTVDESPSLMEPSLRYQLVELLGRDRLVAELAERIDALPEPDWYAGMRKREMRRWLKLG